MTTTAIRLSESTAATPAENLAWLRAKLDDPAERDHWDDIKRAIDYLIGDTFVRDLAA